MKDGDLAWSGTHAACVLRGIMYKASRAHMGDLRTGGEHGELGGHSAVNKQLTRENWWGACLHGVGASF